MNTLIIRETQPSPKGNWGQTRFSSFERIAGSIYDEAMTDWSDRRRPNSRTKTGVAVEFHRLIAVRGARMMKLGSDPNYVDEIRV
jgi:hypothetical protein